MSRPHRLPDASLYSGIRRYFLTICVHGRRPVFSNPTEAAFAVVHLLQSARAAGSAIHAYCVMPDHVHVLCEGQHPQASLQVFVRRFKQYSAFAHSRRTGRRLWQEGYYDHVVREGDATAAIARYVIENPVRAGLVTNPSHYEFCGSTTATLEDLFAAPAWVPDRLRR